MIDFVNLSIQYSGKYLFEDINLKINKEDKIALVGANGTGKSTLLKLLTNKEQPESGKIVAKKNIRIGYLPQEFIESKGKTVKEEVKSSLADILNIESEEIKIQRELELTSDEEHRHELVHELAEIHELKERVDYYTLDSRIEKVLQGLGFSNNDLNRLTDEFSGGWQMRIQLAKILLSSNDIILLDEPTNHLDMDSLRWLIDFLVSYKGSLVIVSHDKYFVNKVTNKTLEIFNRKVSFYNGKYDAYLRFKEERDIQLVKDYEAQKQKIKDTQKFIERFRYKATKAKQVQSRVKQLEKLDDIELPDSEKKINVKFPEPAKSGVIPVEVRHLYKSYGANKVLNDVNIVIERGDKIALVGPNGAGKTTLAKILADKLAPSSGEIVVGHNAAISYYAQEVADDLNLTLDVIDAVAEAATDKTPGELRNLLGSFLFSDDDIFKKVQVLSGGEKSRVAIAKILLQKANVVILDEPTNHLDITSKAILQKALIDFSGAIILVSHDVDFLEPIVNKVIEIRDGGYRIFHGGIDYYLQKTQELKQSEQSRVSTTNLADSQLSKKEQKRVEAELRQKRYKSTKDLKKSIEEIELKISKAEEEKDEIETQLADDSLYRDAEKAKSINADYAKIKARLEQLYANWAEISEKLETIEKEFEDLSG
ncbi:MAG: ABC transporter ATP-binding protein [Melioribacteraceae bacterium]|nr:MAG: ABC transporter ATP-binding protein [Melioribacteraceae bacterium]